MQSYQSQFTQQRLLELPFCSVLLMYARMSLMQKPCWFQWSDCQNRTWKSWLMSSPSCGSLLGDLGPVSLKHITGLLWGWKEEEGNYVLNSVAWRSLLMDAYMRGGLSKGKMNMWPELYRIYENINGLWGCQYITLSPETRPAHYERRKNPRRKLTEVNFSSISTF